MEKNTFLMINDMIYDLYSCTSLNEIKAKFLLRLKMVIPYSYASILLHPSMETAILVSDCSRRGVQAVGRIAELIRECEMKPSRVGLIINRAPKAELNPGILEEIQKQGLDLIGVVPQDEAVYEYDCDGKPTVTLPEDNPMRKAAFEIFDKLGL